MILLLFSLMTLNGQNSERQFLIDISGGYQIHQNNVSIGDDINFAKTKSGKVALGINYKVNKFLYIGVGLEYMNWNSQQENHHYNVDDANNNTFLFVTNNNHRNSIFLPSLNAKLFHFISDKWFIGLNIKNGYGFMNTKDDNMAIMQSYYTGNQVVSPSNIVPINSGYNKDIDRKYYTLSLEPELIYFITKKVGLKMQVVGCRFDSENSSQFFFSSKSDEIFWTVGISLALK